MTEGPKSGMAQINDDHKNGRTRIYLKIITTLISSFSAKKKTLFRKGRFKIINTILKIRQVRE